MKLIDLINIEDMKPSNYDILDDLFKLRKISAKNTMLFDREKSLVNFYIRNNIRISIQDNRQVSENTIKALNDCVQDLFDYMITKRRNVIAKLLQTGVIDHIAPDGTHTVLHYKINNSLNTNEGFNAVDPKSKIAIISSDDYLCNYYLYLTCCGYDVRLSKYIESPNVLFLPKLEIGEMLVGTNTDKQGDICSLSANNDIEISLFGRGWDVETRMEQLFKPIIYNDNIDKISVVNFSEFQ